MKRFLILVLLAVALALPGAAAAVAQTAITVLGEQATNRFPNGLLFSISAQSSNDIQKVILHYSLSGGGTDAYALPNFTPGKTVRAEHPLEGNAPPRNYIAPGTMITYFWELEDAAGNVLNTPEKTIAYDDTRFRWQSISAGSLTLNWYVGSRSLAERLLRAGSDTLESMGKLTGANIDFPVKVWAYGSTEDMRLAMQRRSEVFSSQVVTLGQRVSDDTVLILLAADAEETLRHELTHVVTRVAGEGAFGSLPAWLDEGTAVYGQLNPGRLYAGALESAVRRDNLFSIRSMSALTGDPSRVDLWYGQAWSLVKFLIDNHGPEKFAQLFATFKEGSTVDNALKRVYGFDQNGLEDAWRQSLGLQPRGTQPEEQQRPPQPTPAGSSQQPQPSGTTASPVEGGGDPFPIVQVVLIIMMVALLAGTVAWGGRILGHRLR